MYGLPVFWKSKSGKLLTTLSTMQNKSLWMITGAFCTTNITAMEIEASIPPIDIWMDYILKMEVLHISRLAEDHPIVFQLYPEHQNHSPPASPPPLPPFNDLKRYRSNLKLKLTTCITCISKRTVKDTEQILPNAELPWRPSEEDLI